MYSLITNKYITIKHFQRKNTNEFIEFNIALYDVFSENARVTRIKLDEISVRAVAQVRDADHIHQKHPRIRQ